MRIVILGGGWYGCHLAATLQDEHDVRLMEKAPRLFSGASGNNPARLHTGAHYPRSHATRLACRSHSQQFMARYGPLTRAIARNIYAVAAHDSLVDFGNYEQTLRGEIDMLRVFNPTELGLQNVQGAIEVGERHILINEAREHFTDLLGTRAIYHVSGYTPAIDKPDLLIDCTFCSADAEGVERYEPCLTVLMEGPTSEAVTIMDGPFPSLYPWSEAAGLCSLTSAKYTPIAQVLTWAAANDILQNQSKADLQDRTTAMLEQMEFYLPRVRDTHKPVGELLGIRAMPRSGAASRLVHVFAATPRHLRIRAGKIDAIFEAERQVREHIRGLA